jgi:hypothetical protein
MTSSDGSVDDSVGTVIAVLLDGPTCLECVAAKTHVTLDGVAAAILEITKHLEVHSDRSHCGVCDEDALVFCVQKSTRAAASGDVA